MRATARGIEELRLAVRTDEPGLLEFYKRQGFFVDDTISIPVRLRSAGHRDARAEIVVKLNGREVARKAFDLADGDDLTETLSFVPTVADAEAGKQELTASVRL